ncbi:response regulator transcription factor [Murimonas intestini]|uniref:Stage 0 sporulation protein A homolog n=1 Tax=Murimonas intestini TaxID=1337051 RepID=A0AB73T6N1_9FIRM|nr:response regulator transcription factor [Murimonas intestini]MCR1839534.1 response regulator transcription factor [Murimonas intestini]MCR1882505.1 response regulator transcription factor [Murimonas intestini]
MSFDYIKEKKILLVDDEPDILEMLISILKEDGYSKIETAATAAEAFRLCRSHQPQIAVLDVMLPDEDGFSLFGRIREFSDLPVLFLTARGEDDDKFKGLGLGADDYMVKPFLPLELTLRISAILRRCYKNEAAYVTLDACSIDFTRAEIIKGQDIIALTAKEHELLSVLSRNAGRIVTIDMLCEALWGDNPFGYENSLMAHIRRIREKIEANPSRPVSLVTVKGLGYRLITKEVPR